MSTRSFYEDMVLETEEELRRLEEAFEEADRRGPIDTSGAAKPVEDAKEAWRIFCTVLRDDKPSSGPRK